MRKYSEILTALQKAVLQGRGKETGVVFQINALDVLDLENVPEEAFVSMDFAEEDAEEIVAGLQIGRLEPLGKVMGVKFLSDHSTPSLWGNT